MCDKHYYYFLLYCRLQYIIIQYYLLYTDNICIQYYGSGVARISKRRWGITKSNKKINFKICIIYYIVCINNNFYIYYLISYNIKYFLLRLVTFLTIFIYINLLRSTCILMSYTIIIL